MAKFDSPLALYKGQLARFEHDKMSMRRGHKDVADQGLLDALKLVSGASPSGIARKRLLRALGHPYGRGMPTPGKKVGRQRGASKAALQSAGLKGQLPNLPIGNISFRLRRAMALRPISTDALQAFGIVGGVPYAQYILSDLGTRKMVGRGFQRQIRQNWRARNKAFIDHFSGRQARTNP